MPIFNYTHFSHRHKLSTIYKQINKYRYKIYMKLKGSVVFLGQRGVVGRDRPACFFSVTVPLRWRISRSTRPNDMRPRVRPDMIPAKRTRKQEIPA